jgi:hypothetical protein
MGSKKILEAGCGGTRPGGTLQSDADADHKAPNVARLTFRSIGIVSLRK